MTASISLRKTLQLATRMFPTSLNTATLEKAATKWENKKVSGKVKYNLKI